MSITYRPPFDEDDERDLRALYRKPGPGPSPELDAAVRRTWHPGHSWHPGWAAAACAAMVAGLFAWTDMRVGIDVQDMNAQLAAPLEAAASAERSPAPAPAALAESQPAATQRVVASPNGTAASPLQAAPTAPETAAAATAQQGDATATEVVAFSEQDVEARVAHIRALVQNDQQDEALQALRDLQQGVPDLALPDDLQELAQQTPA